MSVSTHSHPKVAALLLCFLFMMMTVSTHSHPKVAANNIANIMSLFLVSTHSHPKVAAFTVDNALLAVIVSTHSHPKVAAIIFRSRGELWVSFNTQPPEGGCFCLLKCLNDTKKFQHTATRRWLQSGGKSD